MTDTEFTTPDGRTVEDLVAHQFDDMLVDLDRAAAELMELIDVGHTKLQRMRQEDPSALRGSVAHDVGTIAEVLGLIEGVRDDLLTRHEREAFTRDMFAAMAAQNEEDQS